MLIVQIIPVKFNFFYIMINNNYNKKVEKLIKKHSLQE